MKTKKQTKTQNTSKINDNVENIFDKLDENNHLKIIKLVISDFKSFKGVHEIPLCMDYTAIMGATGSGKSNILDALSFVLGATSVSLRSEKLNSLINSSVFKTNSNQQNTQKSKENSFVELHLTIQNSNEDKQKEDDSQDLLNSSEIILKRKLNSDSNAFYINDKKLSANEYISIIENAKLNSFASYFVYNQGSVDRLFKKNKNNLTDWIENLSGSIKFKKEYDSLKEINDKLNESIKEKNSYLNTLKNKQNDFSNIVQAEKKLDQINEEIKNIVEEIFLLTLNKTDLDIAEANNILNEFKPNMERLELKRNELIDKLKVLKKNWSKSNDSNDNKLLSEIENLENHNKSKLSELQSFSEKIDNLEGIIMGKISLMNEEKQNIEDNTTKGKIIIDSKLSLLKIKTELTKQLNDRLGVNDMTDEDIVQFSNIKSEFEKAALFELEELKSLKTRLFNEEFELIQEEKKVSNLENEISKLKEIYSKDKKEKELKDSKIEKLKMTLNEDNKEIIEISKRINNIENNISIKQKSINEITEKLNKITLESGLSNKRKKIKELCLPGVIGFLNELIQPRSPIYELAIQVSLNHALGYLVVKDEDTAELCNKFLVDNKISQEVIVAEHYKETHNNVITNKDSQYGTYLINLIETKHQDVKNVINYFVNKIFYCKDKSHISTLHDLGYKNLILQDGTIANKGYFKGGKYKNLISLNSVTLDLPTLNNEKLNLEISFNELLDEKMTLEQTLSNKKEEISKNQTAINLLTNDRDLLNKRFFAVQQSVEEHKSNLDILNNKIKKIKSLKKELEDKLKSKESSLLESKKIFYKSYDFKNLSQSTIEKLKSTLDVKDYESIQNEIFLIEQRISKSEEELRRYSEKEKMMKKLEETLKQDREKMKEYNNKKDELQREIKSNQESLKELNDKYKTIKSKKDEAKGKIESVELEINRNENKLKGCLKSRMDYEVHLANLYNEKEKLIKEVTIFASNILSKLECNYPNPINIDANKYIKSVEEININNLKDDSNSLTNLDSILDNSKSLTNYIIDYSSLDIEDTTNSKEKISSIKVRLENHEKELKVLLVDKEELAQLKVRFQSDQRVFENKQEEIDKKYRIEQELLDDLINQKEDNDKKFFEIKNERKRLFNDYFMLLQKEIGRMYASFYEGKFNQIDNCATIFNTISNEPYNGYTIYNPNPPGKDKSPGINNLSGGERTIAVTALLLSMQKISKIPFIVFDEIDAYLDKNHEEILEKKIVEHSKHNQVLIVTHKTTISRSANGLIGVYYNKGMESSLTISLNMNEINLH